MLDFFSNIDPILQTLIATLFAYLFTILGSSLVYLFKNPKKTLMDALLGCSGGLMLSASFFSLLLPAIENAKFLNQNAAITISAGFTFGAILLLFTDKIATRVIANSSDVSQKKRIFMLLFSITIHNIPEGLIIGLSFGNASFINSCLLTLGIALQNLPEGSALSLPLHRDGFSKNKSFFYGQISGAVEPIAGILAALLAQSIRECLPFFLSFAAGAMTYVVIQEIIPESQNNERKNLITFITLLGFVIMMLLEICLG